MKKRMRLLSAGITALLLLQSFAPWCSVAAAPSESEGKLSEKVLTGLPVSWDLTELYEDEDAFEADMKRAEDLMPEIETLRGTLNSVEGILNILEDPKLLEIDAILNKAFMYSELLSTLNASDPLAGKVSARLQEIYQKYYTAYAFKDAEIMEMSLDKRQEIFSDERLAPYAYSMRKYTDPDYVVLGEEAKKVEAIMEPAINSRDTRDIFDYVELPKPSFTYPDGTEGTLTDQEYYRIIESKEYDHEFRKEIYELRNSMRQPYANTYASLLEGAMRGQWAKAQIHGYSSTLEAALDDSDLDPEIYDKMIDFTHSMLPKFSEYFDAKKKALGLEEFMLCDIYQPVSGYEAREATYEEVVNAGRAGISEWGDEYLEVFDRIIESPHIDVYPSETKATGAGEELKGNEAFPFVYLNFDGLETYASTIVHEMGHAVYSELSAENQNTYNNNPGIFTQEVASLSNELMFNKANIEKAEIRAEKLFWLDKEISLLFNNIPWQCLMSEFEDYCYKTIENGGALDSGEMAEKWLKLNNEYYGGAVDMSEDQGIDWARIPHMYYDYYVYKYACAMTYAASICEKVEENGQEAIDSYMEFLKAGSSASPEDLLEIAGIDPLDDSTYEAAGALIGELIDEFVKEAEEASKLPMDPSVMKPWINSNVMGMVTDEVTADPKDDFYLSVNHDWLRDVKLPPGYPEYAPVYEAIETVTERCLEFLTDKTLTGDDAKRIQDYYELWLDWDSRNELGISPVLPYMEKLLSVKTLDEMSELLLSEENRTWGKTLAGLDIGVNSKDSNLYEVEINRTALSLSDPAEYKELTGNGKREKEISDQVYSYMLSRIGLSDKEIEETLADMYAFEEKLSEYEMTMLEENDPASVKAHINPVTMEDIREMSPNYPLAEYMEKFGWAGSKLINLAEPKWLSGLNELYTEENLPGIKAYMLSHSISPYISAIDEEAFREYQRIRNGAMGISGSVPDEEIAYNETRALFSNCFARLYVDCYLNEDIRQEITDLCRDAIDTYYDMFETVDWLSEETRKEAQNKLAHMTVHAVYPDKWEDDSMYKVTGKEDGGSYLNAILDYKEASYEDALDKINKTVDKELWRLDILETNAFYEETDNSINIIPGFFCDATYRSDMSIEEKYARLGSVIGHEISHAFDTSGAQYDADGNINNWWTDEDYAAFTERAGKLAAYFDQVVAFDDGTPCHGQMVQGEAIADMAGLKCMLEMAKKIEGFDYDAFFKAHANIWALVGTLQRMEEAALTDVHPLNYLRANVSIAQYDEFYDTYGIKEGDGMYIAPEDRIAVW